jgi:hypothetical protein
MLMLPFSIGDNVSDPVPRSVRLRYTATGAVAALADTNRALAPSAAGATK